jgi:hypothetical protein
MTLTEKFGHRFLLNKNCHDPADVQQYEDYDVSPNEFHFVFRSGQFGRKFPHKLLLHLLICDVQGIFAVVVVIVNVILLKFSKIYNFIVNVKN